ncbi:MAG: DUF5671 domain-containing protein [Candidatus Paceibacterota bacterium]|jgi:hypothetical protein
MNQKTTAKDFFLYLGVIIGLYVSSVSFLMLIFQIIEKLFPLAGEYAGNIDYSIRGSLAALIIFFPAFIYIGLIANKDLKANPEKKDMWVRRWMIYLTLFISGLTVAIDLSTLLYRLLGAEDLTLRFFLKVLFVLAVAVTIFKFTFADLKRTSFEIAKWMKISIGIISVVILSAVIYGIVIIGSPAKQKAKQLDDQRVNDLNNIQSQIVYSQWQNKGTVPTSLEALKDPISGFTLPTDPETQANYGYKKISKNSFQLCADFKTVATTTLNSITGKRVSTPYPYGSDNENWFHKATTTCFIRVIDEKLYPIGGVNNKF